MTFDRYSALYHFIAGGTTQPLATQPVVRQMLQDGDDGSVLWICNSFISAFYYIQLRFMSLKDFCGNLRFVWCHSFCWKCNLVRVYISVAKFYSHLWLLLWYLLTWNNKKCGRRVWPTRYAPAGLWWHRYSIGPRQLRLITWPLTLEVMTHVADAGHCPPSVYQVWSS